MSTGQQCLMWNRPLALCATHLRLAATAASTRTAQLLPPAALPLVGHHVRYAAAAAAASCVPPPMLARQQQQQQQLWPHQTTGRHSSHHRSALLPRSSAIAAAAAAVEPSQTGARSVASSSTSPSSSKQSVKALKGGAAAQTLDYTSLVACCHELNTTWVPSKVEEVVQPDKFTLALRLRTPLSHGWLHLSWHPTAARLCVGRPPARGDVSEGFTLAQQVSSHLKGLVLVAVGLPAAWERVAQLDFGSRPGEPPSKRLYCEVMAKYSNVVLTDADGSILLCAYQVGGSMSSLRQVQQGRAYQLPPRAQGIAPNPDEILDSWRDNVTRAAELPASASGPTQQHHQQQQQPSTDAAAAGAAERSGSSNGSTHTKPQTLLSGATRAYLGVSPALVEELCLTAGVLPSAEPSSLSPETWQRLFGAWQGWLTRLGSKDFIPCSCSSSNRFSVLGTYAQQQGTGQQQQPASVSVHQVVDSYYFSLQAGEVYGSLYQRLAGAVKTALKKARGRVYSFEQQLAAAEDAAVVQKHGDIIVANLYRIPPGATQLEAEDWDTGEQVTIPLTPPASTSSKNKPNNNNSNSSNSSSSSKQAGPPAAALTPMEVAEGLYKRARKLRRAVDAVQPLLQAAQQEVDYLESVEQELSQMPPGGSEQELLALRQVQEELIESKVIKPPPEAALLAKAASKGRKAAKRAQKAASAGGAGAGATSAAALAALAGGAAPRQYESPGGFMVLVGRNNKQNDVLSHQIAKPGDVWMHVRGLPGSHTVLKIAPGQEQPDNADLQFAADLAAYFSKGRDAGKVDVIVARAKHLKKPPGAKPGQVLVTKEEGNVVARPSDSVAAGRSVDS